MALRNDWCNVLRARLQTPGWDAATLPDYPPASEQQLRLTEERLGFALPPTLRQLYAEVANGGDVFRNGYWLCGAVGGYPESPLPDGTKTIDQMVSHSGWRLNERVDSALQRHPGAYIQCERAPDFFTTICNEGCGESIELDGLTGRLYQSGCGTNMLAYYVRMGLPIEPGIENDYMTTISFYAPSVEDWIEHQMNGTFPPCNPTELTQEMLRDDGE